MGDDLSFWTTPPNAFFVAKDPNNKKVIGIVAIQPKSSETMELNRLVVDENSRNLGLGRKLVQAVIDESKKLGYTQVYLETTTIQQGARKLYERMGFRQVGVGTIDYLTGPFIPSCLHGVTVVKYLYNIQN